MGKYNKAVVLAEMLGTVFIIIGAVFLSMKLPHISLIFFLSSNIFFLSMSQQLRLHWLFTSQVVLFFFNIVGILNYFII
jgi:hypothetical protein